VGEVGLDFSREGAATKALQIKTFEALLSHSAIPSKVLTVRSRGAENAVIERLQAANATGILHWYSGPVRLIDRALSAGLYFSINPAMLRSQNGRRIIAAIPREDAR
jgi:TatD DNase family protein